MSKKKYIVVPRTQSAMVDGVDTPRGKVTFGGKTAKVVDESMAKDLDQTHGLKGTGDVWVHEDENYTWHERNDGMTDGRNYGIHKYTFSGVDTTGLKTTRDNGYVWVLVDKKQKRMLRTEAELEGYEIVEKGKHGHNRNAKYGDD